MADDEPTLDGTFFRLVWESLSHGVLPDREDLRAALKLFLERLQVVPVADVYTAFGLTYRPWPNLGYRDRASIPLGAIENWAQENTGESIEPEYHELTAEPSPADLWRDALMMAATSVPVNSISPSLSKPAIQRAAEIFYDLLTAGPVADAEVVDEEQQGVQPSDLGRRVRRLREHRALSVTALANAAGMSKSCLSTIESGDRPRPSGEVIYALAQALGTTMADLLGKPPEQQL